MTSLLETFKVKPLIDEVVKEFRVRYRGSDEEEEEVQFKEFPMEQFKGNLILHHLEPVLIEKDAILEKHIKMPKIQEEIKEKMLKEKTKYYEDEDEIEDEFEEEEGEEKEGQEEGKKTEKEPKLKKKGKTKTQTIDYIVDKDWEIKGKKYDKILERLPKSVDLPIIRLPAYYMNNREIFCQFL